MLNIVICEDDNINVLPLKNLLKIPLLKMIIHLELNLFTANPEDVLKNIGSGDIYFLDVEILIIKLMDLSLQKRLEILTL